MHSFFPTRLPSCIAIAALLSSLAACGGGGSAAPAAATTPSVITQSAITLPTSVQVVSAK